MRIKMVISENIPHWALQLFILAFLHCQPISLQMFLMSLIGLFIIQESGSLGSPLTTLLFGSGWPLTFPDSVSSLRGLEIKTALNPSVERRVR
jgi:hypothetical protein